VVALTIVAVALVVGLCLALAVNLRPSPATPLDSETQERWLIAHSPKWLKRTLRYADRRVIGGSAVAVIFVVLFAGALAVGWVFDSIDESRGFARWDEAAAKFGSEHATETSTRVLELITQFGATKWLFILLAIVALVDYRMHRSKVSAAYLAVVGIGILLLNNGLKLLVHRERPSLLMLTSHVGWSFPSGHTAAAASFWAAMAFVLARRCSRRVRGIVAALVVAITVAVATSRVLLGVHWLTDVIAGAATGWTWFAVVTVLFGGRLMRLGEPAERVAAGRVTAVHTDERRELEATK